MPAPLATLLKKHRALPGGLLPLDLCPRPWKTDAGFRRIRRVASDHRHRVDGGQPLTGPLQHGQIACACCRPAGKRCRR